MASSGNYLTDELTDHALSFIERHQDHPFFLQLAYSAPHSPFQAPQPIVEKYLSRGFNRVVATTYAMIEIMDRGIGNVLQRLEDLGLQENTIVLFTSDNGPAFFNPSYMLEPGESTLNERFNCGLRGAKGYVEEGGIRVPMIIRFPTRIEAGSTVDDVVHFTDWYSTLLKFAGVVPAPGPAIDGFDLSPVLCGEQAVEAPRRFWQWNFYKPHIGTNAAMRDGKWKLIRPTISGTRFFNKELYATAQDEALMQAFVEAEIEHKENPENISRLIPVPKIWFPSAEPLQLYDLENDPGEQIDLAAREPARVARMLTDLETWFEDVEAERLRAVEAKQFV